MKIHIFGGGTVQYVRNHLALCTPAYGETARFLFDQFGAEVAQLHLTRMADSMSKLETNEDVELKLKEVLADVRTSAVIFNVALCDYSGTIGDIPSGKYATRLSSRDGQQTMSLTPTSKLLNLIKAMRPDVYGVGFKTTAGANRQEQHRLALRQIAETGCDLVLANDTLTRENILVSADDIEDGTRSELLKDIARKAGGRPCKKYL